MEALETKVRKKRAILAAQETRMNGTIKDDIAYLMRNNPYFETREDMTEKEFEELCHNAKYLWGLLHAGDVSFLSLILLCTSCKTRPPLSNSYGCGYVFFLKNVL